MTNHALIQGAGIAGLTAAYWLQKHGWETQIVEKTPKMRTEGYMIYTFGNGWLVAKKMGLIKQIIKIKYPMKKIQYVNSKGKPYFTVQLKKIKQAFKNNYNFLLRSDLVRIILEETLKTGTEIIYNKEITQLKETKNTIEAQLSDGTTNNYDIIIGADGIYSNIRNMIFGNTNTPYHSLGYVLSVFHTSKHQEIDDNFKIYQEPGKQSGFYPISEDTMDAVFIFRHKTINTRTIEKKSFLLKIYKDSSWITKQVIENASKEQILLLDNIQQIKNTRWSNGRTVLIGDACACLSPLAGQGASMAMLEAYILAEKLHQHKNYKLAFHEYEIALKPDILKRQIQTEGMATKFVPKTKLQLLSNMISNRIYFSKLFINRTAINLTGKIHVNEI